MRKLLYGKGDHVFLIDDPIKTGQPEGEFTIVACLPDINGIAQYRVKSVTENFERRIIGTDIDTERSARPQENGEKAVDTAPSSGSWLNRSSIKVGK